MTRTQGPRLVAAGPVLLLALLVACGCDAPGDVAGEPADPTSTAVPPPADFTSTVTAGPGAVTVSYSFTNTSTEPVLVVQGPPGSDGQQDPDRLVFATGLGADVVLSRRAFPTPDPSNVDFAQAPRVGAIEVGPGQEVHDEFGVALPLTRLQPYGDDLGFGTIALPDPVAGVRFCLGVVGSPYPPAISLDTTPDGTTIANGTTTAAAQHLFCSDVEPLP